MSERLSDGDLRALMEMALNEGSGACVMDGVTLGKLVRELQNGRLRERERQYLSAEERSDMRWVRGVVRIAVAGCDGRVKRSGEVDVLLTRLGEEPER